MHAMGMRGDGNNWQIASSRDRQITGARSEGGFRLACAGIPMTVKSSRSRWPGVVKATAEHTPRGQRQACWGCHMGCRASHGGWQLWRGGNDGSSVDDATYGDGKDNVVEVGSSSGGDMATGRRRRSRSAAAAETTASAAGGCSKPWFWRDRHPS